MKLLAIICPCCKQKTYLPVPEPQTMECRRCRTLLRVLPSTQYVAENIGYVDATRDADGAITISKEKV